MESLLRAARGYDGPVIVHVITQKGRGYAPAENDEADRFHGVGVIDPETGDPVGDAGPTWTAAFADELVTIGHERPDVVAITAAMLCPTGLDRFAAEFPDRTYDVGIAEQHALTSAAGMAFAGLHPVVAVYATFLNRAFDQVLMDVALHRAGVTVVLDRAGVTGDDGASHNGMWDLSMLNLVPGIRSRCPGMRQRCARRCARRWRSPTARRSVRFPKGRLAEPLPAVSRSGGVDLLHADPDPQILLVGLGSMAGCRQGGCGQAGRRRDRCVTVAAPLWVTPLPAGVVELAGEIGRVVTVEDNGLVGGFGASLVAAVPDAGLPCANGWASPRSSSTRPADPPSSIGSA